jgi:hypothetical protein
MLVKPVQLQNALLPILVTLSGMVTLVKFVKKLNAIVPMLVIVALGNTIDTIQCIPLGTVAAALPVPVVKAPAVFLVLADRSRVTFFSAVCNASSNCVQPLLSVPISPKSICMGRGTGSAVCDLMYSTKVTERVSV